MSVLLFDRACNKWEEKTCDKWEEKGQKWGGREKETGLGWRGKGGGKNEWEEGMRGTRS